jgi:hypothetical protein
VETGRDGSAGCLLGAAALRERRMQEADAEDHGRREVSSSKGSPRYRRHLEFLCRL